MYGEDFDVNADKHKEHSVIKKAKIETVAVEIECKRNLKIKEFARTCPKESVNGNKLAHSLTNANGC